MRYLSIFLISCIFSFSSLAQARVQIPAPSPSASVVQTVSTTEISVQYSSPAVKGRKVWGGLEKWGVAWRAGANAATKISFDKDVKISGKDVKAGSYSLFITPMKKGNWKIHLNTGASVFAYQKDGMVDMNALMEKDVVMVTSMPQMTKTSQERLMYHINITGETTAEVVMNWEKVFVKLPIEVMPASGSEKAKPSPDASREQTVGITKFKVSYSSPGVKSRKIWGNLVKWNTPWRAGANSPTKISFDKDVTIAGKMVKAGSYSVFITPMEKGDWKVHLNKGNGVFAYQKDGVYDMEALMSNDAVTISVAPEMSNDSKERLTYHVMVIDDNTAEVVMNWEKVKVKFRATFNTTQLAAESIEKGFTAQWYTYANSAKYYLENNLDAEKAMGWAKISLILQPNHFFNKWVMAMVLNKQGDKKEAMKYAKAAQEFGMKNPSNFYNAYKKPIAEGIAMMSK